MGSLARRENLEKNHGLMKKSQSKKEFVYPVPYFGHRWCKNKNYLHCAVEMWPSFSTFVNLLMKLPKTKRPVKGEGKRFLVLQKAVDDPLI